MRKFWTEDDISKLKKLWSEGKTALEISKKIDNTTRSSVMAKVRRLNLASRVDKPTQPRPKSTAFNAHHTKEKGPHKKYKPTLERERISSTAFGNKCSLEDLPAGCCCWPIGDPRDKEDFGFCGAKKETPGRPYCSEHAKIS